MCWLFLHMAKPFKTYDEQIGILKSRGLIITNEAEAIRFLETENYYNVINGYKTEFLIPDTDLFANGVTFENIQALYSFDKAFRHGILSTLLDIENMLKSIIAYEFARQYGATAYLNIASYNVYGEKSRQAAQELIDSINEQIVKWKDNTDHSNDNIRHYLAVHGEIPIWVLFSHIMIRDLCKFFQCLTPNLKDLICQHIVSIYGKKFKSDDLYAFLRILKNVRNLCAHNLRIYNYKTQYIISKKNGFVKAIKKQFGDNFKINNIISVIIVIYHLCSREKIKTFFDSFIAELGSLVYTPSQLGYAFGSDKSNTLTALIMILFDITK